VLGEPYKLPEEKKSIAVDENILKQYTGEYQLAPTFIIVISFANGNLMAQATGQAAAPVYAEKENLFFFKVVEAKIEFVKDSDGNVTDMILFQNGQQLKGKKIK
jgi:hypothetical protein